MKASQPGSPEPASAVLIASLSLVQCFTGTSIPTVVVSADPADVAFYSRYSRRKKIIANSVTQPDRAVEDLLELGRTFSDRPVLFYEDQQALLFVSRNREALAKFYHFLLPPPHLVEACVDELRFADLARTLRLPFPRTFTSRQLATPDELINRLGLPCLVKADTHKAVCVHDAEHLSRLCAGAKHDFVIQEYIPSSDDSSYTFHAYCDRQCNVLGCYVGRETPAPIDSDTSPALELVDAPDLVGIAVDILKRLNFVGVATAHFRKDMRTGQFYLLGIQPTFSVWNYLGKLCGVNLPVLAYADLLGQPYQVPTRYQPPAKWQSWATVLRRFLSRDLWSSVLGLLHYSRAVADRIVPKGTA